MVSPDFLDPLEQKAVLERKVTAAWQIAGSALGISVVAPFVFQHRGVSYPCLAYLPCFGGGKGMLIRGFFRFGDEGSPSLPRAAAAAGYYVSSVNLEVYTEFDEKVFKEALLDWGYSGPEGDRPAWCMHANEQNDAP